MKDMECWFYINNTHEVNMTTHRQCMRLNFSSVKIYLESDNKIRKYECIIIIMYYKYKL